MISNLKDLFSEKNVKFGKRVFNDLAQKSRSKFSDVSSKNKQLLELYDFNDLDELWNKGSKYHVKKAIKLWRKIDSLIKSQHLSIDFIHSSLIQIQKLLNQIIASLDNMKYAEKNKSIVDSVKEHSKDLVLNKVIPTLNKISLFKMNIDSQFSKYVDANSKKGFLGNKLIVIPELKELAVSEKKLFSDSLILLLPIFWESRDIYRQLKLIISPKNKTKQMRLFKLNLKTTLQNNLTNSSYVDTNTEKDIVNFFDYLINEIVLLYNNKGIDKSEYLKNLWNKIFYEKKHNNFVYSEKNHGNYMSFRKLIRSADFVSNLKNINDRELMLKFIHDFFMDFNKQVEPDDLPKLVLLLNEGIEFKLDSDYTHPIFDFLHKKSLETFKFIVHFMQQVELKDNSSLIIFIGLIGNDDRPNIDNIKEIMLYHKKIDPTVYLSLDVWGYYLRLSNANVTQEFLELLNKYVKNILFRDTHIIIFLFNIWKEHKNLFDLLNVCPFLYSHISSRPSANNFFNISCSWNIKDLIAAKIDFYELGNYLNYIHKIYESPNLVEKYIKLFSRVKILNIDSDSILFNNEDLIDYILFLNKTESLKEIDNLNSFYDDHYLNIAKQNQIFNYLLIKIKKISSFKDDAKTLKAVLILFQSLSFKSDLKNSIIDDYVEFFNKKINFKFDHSFLSSFVQFLHDLEKPIKTYGLRDFYKLLSLIDFKISQMELSHLAWILEDCENKKLNYYKFIIKSLYGSRFPKEILDEFAPSNPNYEHPCDSNILLTLNELKNHVSDISWSVLIEGLYKILKSKQKSNYVLFSKTLPAYCDYLDKDSWMDFIDFLIFDLDFVENLYYKETFFDDLLLNLKKHIPEISEGNRSNIWKRFKILFKFLIESNKLNDFIPLIDILPFESISKFGWDKFFDFVKEFVYFSLNFSFDYLQKNDYYNFIQSLDIQGLKNHFGKLYDLKYLDKLKRTKDIYFIKMHIISYFLKKYSMIGEGDFSKAMNRIYDLVYFIVKSTDFRLSEQLLNYLSFESISKFGWDKFFDFVTNFLKTGKKFHLILNFVPDTSFESFFQNLDYSGLSNFYNTISDERYNTVQGISSLGFLTCHVTNAFGGGAALKPGEERRSDAFLNIKYDIIHQGTRRFQLSSSSIKPGVKTKLAMTKRYGIDGSVGIVLDSGYFYETYSSDAGTVTGTKNAMANLKYRTGQRFNRKDLPAKLAINYSKSEGRYNELLVRKWTVGSLFYTINVQDFVIEELKKISDEYSFEKYLNPEWINRNIKIGPPKYIEKVFPIYEIDYENNTWKLVYTPEKSNKKFSNNSINELNPQNFMNILEHDYSAENLVSFFEKKYFDLFSASVGVGEGYSLREHTLMCLNKFDEYFSTKPSAVSLNFFRTFLALHDLGKPLAVKAGNKDMQHKFTPKLIFKTMQNLNFTKQECLIALNLVTADTLGVYIKKRNYNQDDVKKTKESILKAAKRCGLEPRQYLDILEIYYKSDASSYPYLFNKLFDVDKSNRILNFKKELQSKFDLLKQINIS